jgi:hypothetical protein
VYSTNARDERNRIRNRIARMVLENEPSQKTGSAGGRREEVIMSDLKSFGI